jgi:hypothetical protein
LKAVSVPPFAAVASVEKAPPIFNSDAKFAVESKFPKNMTKI